MHVEVTTHSVCHFYILPNIFIFSSEVHDISFLDGAGVLIRSPVGLGNVYQPYYYPVASSWISVINSQFNSGIGIDYLKNGFGID